ncbi:DUF4192 domain-containing protein [Pseudonocardia sp. ICBG1293]|uniref:DUF4192 domain-containing protein n=1 Tax=Pseudonocardia sp. ICBG1293 TaxID=2844382 RepID=UPI001CC9AD2D|nr:DUF4192 domain-containing protein [Pseudonocardia sp. ICBG1293]
MTTCSRPDPAHPPPGPGDPPAPGRSAGTPGPLPPLDRPAELISAIPVLLGFHPRDSLVLVSVTGPPPGGRIGLTVRVDLPRSSASARRVCADAVDVLTGAPPDRALAVVVRDPGPAGPGPRRSRGDVGSAARRALLAAGIEPIAALWATGTGAGDRWGCFDLPCTCGGTLPDPASTTLGVTAAVRDGRVVLPDRAAVLAPLDGDAGLRRRRARLRDSGAAPARVSAGTGTALLEVCLEEAAAGRLVVDDRLALALCGALDLGEVRDEALRHCLGRRATDAEQLWAVLVAALPSPQRTHPLALLAVCALLRGDGALATGAVERALVERPDHVLAGVVATCLHGTRDPRSPAARWAGPAGLRRLLTTMLDPHLAPGRTDR